MIGTAMKEPALITELSDSELEAVGGGIVPFVLVYVAASGVITGAGIYLVTEYLT